MKIVFFGTPKFSAPFLESIIADKEIEVVAVVTQPDKPAGRGGKISESPIKKLAKENNKLIFDPNTLKSDKVVNQLSDLKADAFIVVAYGKIIPESILEIPRLGCINVHPSLLPKYRGPSPMQWAIANGDAFTGVTIMLLDKGMDTGPILASEKINLDKNETYPSLMEKVQIIGPKLLIKTLEQYDQGKITPKPQDNSKATITKLLDREDGHVDWTKTAKEIEQKHRAYQPWPGSWSQLDSNRIKLIKIKPTESEPGHPAGTIKIQDRRMFVSCVDGTFEILELQSEGSRQMDAKTFINGHKNINNQKFT